MTGHPRYAIIGTESRLLRSRFVDQEFQISVALPVFHGRGVVKKCPVIYLLDANFYFGLVTEMTRIMAQCSEFLDTVVVGIGYPWQEPAHVAYDLVSGLRTRDLTPVISKFAESEVLKYCPGLTQVESGGAGKFLQFVTEELIPWVEAEYPAEPSDRMLLGHSWGGLFALYELLHATAFNRYVVCDPDVNYEDRILFEQERAYSEAHDNLRARLFIAVSNENPPPRREFTSILEQQDYEDLTIIYKEMLNCQHCELVGPSFQAGLKAVFG